MNDCLVEIEELLVEELAADLQNPHEKIQRILIRFQERFAKGSIYIPFNYQARNAEIAARYNGCNERQLAREYCLSYRQISKIVKIKKQLGC